MCSTESAEHIEAPRALYPAAALGPRLPAARGLAGVLFLEGEFGEFLAFRTNPGAGMAICTIVRCVPFPYSGCIVELELTEASQGKSHPSPISPGRKRVSPAQVSPPLPGPAASQSDS